MVFSQTLDVLFLMIGYIIEIAWIVLIAYFIYSTNKRLNILENKLNKLTDAKSDKEYTQENKKTK